MTIFLRGQMYIYKKHGNESECSYSSTKREFRATDAWKRVYAAYGVANNNNIINKGQINLAI